MIDSYAVRSTNGILTTITLTDRILLVVLTVEVELELVDNLAWSRILLVEISATATARADFVNRVFWLMTITSMIYFYTNYVTCCNRSAKCRV